MREIAVIGLGYVGLPLYFELNKHFKVIGYDINRKRVRELNSQNDINSQIRFNKYKKKKSFYK